MISSRATTIIGLTLAIGAPTVASIFRFSKVEFTQDDQSRRLAEHGKDIEDLKAQSLDRRLTKVEGDMEDVKKALADIRSSTSATQVNVDWLVRYFRADALKRK